MELTSSNPYAPRYHISHSFHELWDAVQRWAGTRVGLLRTQWTAKAKRWGLGAAAFAAAGFFALFMWAWLSYSLIEALSGVMARGWAALIVAALHGVLAFGAVAMGRAKLAPPSSETALPVTPSAESHSPLMHFAKEASEDECRREAAVSKVEIRLAQDHLKKAIRAETNPAYLIGRHPVPILIGGFLAGCLIQNWTQKAVSKL